MNQLQKISYPAVILVAMAATVFFGYDILIYRPILLTAWTCFGVLFFCIGKTRKGLALDAAVLILVGILLRDYLLNGFYLVSNKMAAAANQVMDLGLFYYVSIQMKHTRLDCILLLLFLSALAGTALALPGWLKPLLFAVTGLTEIVLLSVAPYVTPLSFGLFLGGWMGWYYNGKEKKRLALAGCVIAIFLSTILSGVQEGTWKPASAMKEKAALLVRDISQGAGNAASGGIGNGEIGKTGAVSPRGTKMFQIKTDGMEDLYLKGFVSDTYKKGSWLKNEKEGKLILGENSLLLPYRFFQLQIPELKKKGLARLLSDKQSIFTIRYQKEDSSYLLWPYFSNPDSLVGTFHGDNDIILANGKKTASFQYYPLKDINRMLNLQGQLGNYLMTQQGINSQDLQLYFDGMEEYNQYIYGNNLSISEKMKSEILKQYGDQWQSDRYSDIISSIQEIFKKNYRYTYTPGVTPSGKDPILYFLKEKKEGYCTQYASAAVMMFRANGIPARYVEGYKIERNRLKKNQYIQITDYSAHAWPEIYVDYAGWVPVEVTYGNGQEQAATVRQQKKAHQQKKEVIPENLVKVHWSWQQSLFVFAAGLVVAGFFVGLWFVYRRIRFKRMNQQEKARYYCARILKSSDPVQENVTDIINKFKYSPHPITEEEIEILRKTCSSLRK